MKLFMALVAAYYCTGILWLFWNERREVWKKMKDIAFDVGLFFFFLTVWPFMLGAIYSGVLPANDNESGRKQEREGM